MVSGVKFYKLTRLEKGIGSILELSNVYVNNIDTENTLSLNIATGGKIAIIKNKKILFSSQTINKRW